LPKPRVVAEPKVILARCASYDAEKIAEIVHRGMVELGLTPRGKTVVKPNIVIAHEKYFKHAYTRAEFVEGVVMATKRRAAETDGQMKSLQVAERCGITIPTRMAFSEAGYKPMARRQKVPLVSLEEVPQVEVALTHEQRLRDYLYTPETIAECDFMISCPKFKAHPWTTVTFALKNWIGIQDDRHRMIDHDFHLDEKIADLQEIVYPDLIAIDAIVGGQDRMLTPLPFDLNLVILGNNSVAVDAVCCNIIGIDPTTVDHIRYCHERGLGPLAPDEIAVTGDVSLEEAQRDAAGFRHGLIRVEDYFADSHITAHAGPPTPDGGCDYCWGGCPGAMEEAIEIIRTCEPDIDDRMRRMHVVFGRYEGPIDAKPGERVIFMGDCAHWKGEINGQTVEVESVYQSNRTKDPHKARFRDIFLKMIVAFFNVFRRRKQPYIRVLGCPVSVAEQVVYIARCGKTKNPYFDFAIAVPFFLAYVANKTVVFFKRLMFRPYQKRRRTH
jgi:uncharacterized protein (DUF362 family)